MIKSVLRAISVPLLPCFCQLDQSHSNSFATVFNLVCDVAIKRCSVLENLIFKFYLSIHIQIIIFQDFGGRSHNLKL